MAAGLCMCGITDLVDVRSKDHKGVGRVTTSTPVRSVASTSILRAIGGNPAPGQRFYRATVSWAIGVVPWTPYTVRICHLPQGIGYVLHYAVPELGEPRLKSR